MMKKKSLVFFDEVFHKRMTGFSGIVQDHILPCVIGNDVMPVHVYRFAFGGAGENTPGSGD